MRLVGGSGPSEGQVELCVSQFWHPVCDDGFTVNEAELICGALGYYFIEGKSLTIIIQRLLHIDYLHLCLHNYNAQLEV